MALASDDGVRLQPRDVAELARKVAVKILCIARQSQPVTEETAQNLSTLSCDALWVRGNSIFKTSGYCFKTPRAIAQFGNTGCAFIEMDRVPLSEADRVLVNQIKSFEQSHGCPR